MSTDSSGGAGFPATTAPALSANYFQTPHPPASVESANQWRSRASRGAASMPTAGGVRALGPHHHGDLLTRQAPGGWAATPRRSGKGGANGQRPLTSPALSCPGGLRGLSPSALRPLWPAPPAWRGGSQSPLWPGLWKRQFL